MDLPWRMSWLILSRIIWGLQILMKRLLFPWNFMRKNVASLLTLWLRWLSYGPKNIVVGTGGKNTMRKVGQRKVRTSMGAWVTKGGGRSGGSNMMAEVEFWSGILHSHTLLCILLFSSSQASECLFAPPLFCSVYAFFLWSFNMSKFPRLVGRNPKVFVIMLQSLNPWRTWSRT